MKTHLNAPLLSSLLVAAFCAPATPEAWYAGTWDSTIYNRAEHPRTIGVRIEVRDGETGLPAADVLVAFKGQWYEEKIGPFDGSEIAPKEPQPREFRLAAKTDQGGVAVFAFQWQKRYPWLIGEPEPRTDRRGNIVYQDVHSTWIRPVDDIEKIQFIETMHPAYLSEQIPFGFQRLTRFGDNRAPAERTPDEFHAFEQAWYQEMTRPGVRFCVLDLGTGFRGFQNPKSQDIAFFQAIRNKSYGTVYTTPQSTFSTGEYPQSECGPYFVYELEVRLRRLPGQADINVYIHDSPRDQIPRHEPTPPSEEDMRREEAQRRAMEEERQQLALEEQRRNEQAARLRQEEEARQQRMLEERQRREPAPQYRNDPERQQALDQKKDEELEEAKRAAVGFYVPMDHPSQDAYIDLRPDGTFQMVDTNSQTETGTYRFVGRSTFEMTNARGQMATVDTYGHVLIFRATQNKWKRK